MSVLLILPPLKSRFERFFITPVNLKKIEENEDFKCTCMAS